MKPARHNRWLSNIWIVMTSIVTAGLVASAYGGTVNPQATPIPAILAMTFPVWLIAAIAMALICLCIRGTRKSALIPVAGILLCTGPIIAYAPVNFNAPDISDTCGKESFTILSYNTLAFNDIQRNSTITDKKALKRAIDNGAHNPIASYIISSDADIACLQEFRGFYPAETLYYTQEQIDSLRLIYPHYRSLNGEDILSRFPLRPVKLRQPESPYAWFGAAIVDIMGHETLVVSVHMQSVGLDADDKELFRDLTDGDVEGKTQIKQVKRQLLGKLAHAFKERAVQAKMLREQIDSIGIENVIVAGDFNDIPGCFALRELCRDDFRSAFTEAGCGPEITYHANRFYFHIDHILYRGAMRAVAYQRGSCPNSDHYPIMARFVWDD